MGIPALEDKLAGSATGRILEQVYEQDFIDDSYGFRPGRGCHDAPRALSQTVETGKIHWIVEADIKGFFDKVKHDWMIEFLSHRVGDKRMQRYVAGLGQTRLIRYADDSVACFASKAEAERFRAELLGRLGKFGLEVEPSKTKVLAFGPGANRLAEETGKQKAETFDFLGFTHYCGRSRNGRRFRMKRRTSRKKFRPKLSAYKECA